jgi:hypothetical protein
LRNNRIKQGQPSEDFSGLDESTLPRGGTRPGTASEFPAQDGIGSKSADRVQRCSVKDFQSNPKAVADKGTELTCERNIAKLGADSPDSCSICCHSTTTTNTQRICLSACALASTTATDLCSTTPIVPARSSLAAA